MATTCWFAADAQAEWVEYQTTEYMLNQPVITDEGHADSVLRVPIDVGVR
jgi:hypothetical protein